MEYRPQIGADFFCGKPGDGYNGDMPISPEMGKMPEMIATFYRAGLVGELIADMVRGEGNRDLVADARRLVKELKKHCVVEVMGIENIPKESGCLVVFNHPNIDVLMPAMLDLITEIFDENGQQVCLAMGSEIPMTTSKFNDKSALPGSVSLLRRFHQLYPNNIISVPTAEKRKDFLTGRAVAVRKIMKEFKKNNIVLISPEGHVEEGGVVSPPETYHEGSGKLGILAASMGIPTVPVGIWKEEGVIVTNVGEPFMIESEEADMAVVEMMYCVARAMPEELRGPFKKI